MNQILSCVVVSSTQIYIKNIASMLTDPSLGTTTNYRVKYSFIGTGLSNTNNYGINFYTTLYSNLDAFTNGYQGIMNSYNSLNTYCYYSNPVTCTLGQSSSFGVFQLRAVTDTYMQVVFVPTSVPQYGGDANYQHHFLISFNGFNYGPSCTISNVVAEMSSSITPGTGTNNSVPVSSAGCAINYIYLIWQGSSFPTIWGGAGPAADGIWQTN